MKTILTLFFTLMISSCSVKEPANEDNQQTIGYYKEEYRPQFHFSPEEIWMNNPNGMVYYEGEYHLFYQYYPDSTVWGPMHWGHAVSFDMVHWEHLPVALVPVPGLDEQLGICQQCANRKMAQCHDHSA